MPYCRQWPACTPLWHPLLDPRAYPTCPGGLTGHSTPVPCVLLPWTASLCPTGYTDPLQPAPLAVPQACTMPASFCSAWLFPTTCCGLSCCACCACWEDLFQAPCNIADSKTRHSSPTSPLGCATGLHTCWLPPLCLLPVALHGCFPPHVVGCHAAHAVPAGCNIADSKTRHSKAKPCNPRIQQVAPCKVVQQHTSYVPSSS